MVLMVLGPTGLPCRTSLFIFHLILTCCLQLRMLNVTNPEITFQWDTYRNAIRYELLVDNNSGFGSPEISKQHIPDLQNLTTSTYTIPGNWLNQNVYYWKVTAILSDNSTIESETESLPIYHNFRHPAMGPCFRSYNSTDKDHFIVQCYTSCNGHEFWV